MSQDQEVGTINSTPLDYGGFRVQHSTHYLMEKNTAQLANINGDSRNENHSANEEKNSEIKNIPELREATPLNQSQEIAENKESNDDKQDETKKKVIIVKSIAIY